MGSYDLDEFTGAQVKWRCVTIGSMSSQLLISGEAGLQTVKFLSSLWLRDIKASGSRSFSTFDNQSHLLLSLRSLHPTYAVRISSFNIIS